MDLSKRALSRVYWQYRNSDKLLEWLDTLPAIAQTEIEDPAQIVVDLLEIDERSGDLLDIIARIVGINRPAIVSTAEGVFTTFASDDQAPQFGESGEQFSATDLKVSDAASDELLRVLIKARVEVNNGDATANDIIRAIRFVSNVNDVIVNDNQDMSFSVSLGGELSSTVRFALKNFDILPRPQGVRFNGFIESPAFTQFGAEFAMFGDERAQFNEVFI